MLHPNQIACVYLCLQLDAHQSVSSEYCTGPKVIEKQQQQIMEQYGMHQI